jgi:hypothetical protein
MATWFFHRTLPPRLVEGKSAPGPGWADSPAAFYDVYDDAPVPDVPVAPESETLVMPPVKTKTPKAPPKPRGRPRKAK